MTQDTTPTDKNTTHDGQCEHNNARVEHTDLHSSEAEFWIACPDCNGYWTLASDLDRLTAHISDDSDEW